MAWDRPLPVDPDVVNKKLRAEWTALRSAMDKVIEQLACTHEWQEQSRLNLGGEREVDVTCAKCGFVWY